MLRLTPAKWTGDQSKGKVPDPNRGPPKLDTFWKKSQKSEVKSQKKKTNAKKKQNKWVLGRVIPWEMGPHFPEKQRLGLRLGGCANHPFLKIYVPIQVLMQGQKPKPNWNSFLHILHVRQIQEPECMKTRQPRLHILHAPLNVNQAGVQKHVRQFAFLNLQHLFWFLCVLHLHFLCIYDFLFLHFLSAVPFCLHFFDPFFEKNYMLHCFKIQNF